VSTIRQTFAIAGMHCTSCAMTIDWELEDIDGVDEARTSYASARTEVTYDPSRVAVETIIDTIVRAGFAAQVLER
jgi:copper chaperone CopZ